ncbi:hypothetical protein SDC49_05075 [Lactobacillus sp. R2/2]|nr:hypothetical protein [Lactobacillus sp. R2/2]
MGLLGNKWVGENKALNQQILRKEWGFRGFIVSDFSEVMVMVL